MTRCAAGSRDSAFYGQPGGRVYCLPVHLLLACAPAPSLLHLTVCPAGVPALQPLVQRKDSVSAAVILETFFQDPLSAVLVKPWRPSGPGEESAGRLAAGRDGVHSDA